MRKADGAFEIMKDDHDFVVGGFDITPYHQYEFDIEKGGAIFVYTDGLPEAMDTEKANDVSITKSCG